MVLPFLLVLTRNKWALFPETRPKSDSSTVGCRAEIGAPVLIQISDQKIFSPEVAADRTTTRMHMSERTNETTKLPTSK